MFKALIGDLFTSPAQTLVNAVNCSGVTGKGAAPEFKKRFSVLFDDYRHRCERGAVKLGEPYLYRDRSGVLVVNFPTKGHGRSSSRIKDIERGLDFLVAHLAEWGIKSIALPALGCGGRLDWTEVGPLIYRKLQEQPIDVEVYAPPGTPPHQLTTAFLRTQAEAAVNEDGQPREKLNANWAVLIEVLRGLQARPDAKPVGRTIFQKICYVVTGMGVPTGFEFQKADYGPFCPEVKAALHTFANRNWLYEEARGRVVALLVGPEYEKDRSRFASRIQEHAKKIAKTVDLFSRIESTEQADEVVTVLFASRELKKGKRTRDVTEQQIHDFVLDWRKSWMGLEKRQSLARTIRSLVAQRWMRAQISES
jgi:O-acetyl-ADP-ribose deacetylase (regulator of RNase III)/uncharacterized protein YwgA